MYKGKITIVGAGFVGSTTAYTLMLSGLASELVLIDINAAKAEGDALDMNHGVSFVTPVIIRGGSDYHMAAGSDMVIITAGVGQKPGETRTQLLGRNVAVFRNILENVLRHCGTEPILLVVTNPVDILTYVTYKLTGYDRRRVIGSGTVLDTARLKYLIGEHTGIDARNVQTYVVGEHGDTEVAAWSATNIAGTPIDRYCDICKGCTSPILCRDEFVHKTKNAAYEIIEKKGATYYAIALSVRRIVEAITGTENSILTVSTLMDGAYGLQDVCLSLPCVVGREGAVRVLETPLCEQEIKDLRHSAEVLKSLAREIGF
jgi:L-lactate dehydrogenase